MSDDKTILIADDDADLCNAIASRCRALGLDAITANDAASALQIVDLVKPDLICLDVEMPRGNGLAVCEMISNDETLASTPVIIITGVADKDTVRRCHNLRAYYVTKGGDIWRRLEPLIRDLLNLGANLADTEPGSTSDKQPLASSEPHDPILDSIFAALGVDEHYLDDQRETQSPTSGSANLPGDASRRPVPAYGSQLRSGANPQLAKQPWILHIDDDSDLSNSLKMRLEAYGVSVMQAFHGMDGVRNAFNQPADAIILDYQMPHGDGAYVLKRLKQCEATRRIPIIVLTGRRDQGLERQLLNLGAERLNKPVRFDVLLNELRQFAALREPCGAACLMA